MRNRQQIKRNAAKPSGVGDGGFAQARVMIVSALNNPKYKARTIAGIVQETKLDRSTVVEALKSDKLLASTVKVNPVRTKDGRVLVTTKDRFLKEASLKEKFIDFFASKRVQIDDAE